MGVGYTRLQQAVEGASDLDPHYPSIKSMQNEYTVYELVLVCTGGIRFVIRDVDEHFRHKRVRTV